MENITPLIKKSYDEIRADILEYINTNTPVTVRNRTATAGIIADIAAAKMAQVYDDLEDALKQPFISTAQGVYLDKLGEMMGADRKSHMRAEAMGKDTLRFQISEKVNKSVSQLLTEIPAATIAKYPTTFPDGQTTRFIIKSGTVVSKPNTGVSYTTLHDAELSDSQNYAYVGIIANGTGSSFNAGEDELTVHTVSEQQPELSNITDYIECTNAQAISNGSDIETDADYRVRIARRPYSAANANRDAIREAALSVPGVSDVSMVRHIYGNGTYLLTVQSTNPVIDSGTLAAVEGAVGQVCSYGETVYVGAPEYLGVMINIELDLAPDADENKIVKEAKEVVAAYINNEGNQKIVINEIVQRVMEIDKTIRDMGITSFGYGTYSRTTGELTDFIYLNNKNQACSSDQRFFSKASYINCCKAQIRKT